MYREILNTNDHLKRRFLQLAEDKGLEKEKVVKKHGDGKARKGLFNA